MLKTFFVHLIVSALLLVCVDYLLTGFAIAGFGHALVAALVLGVVNTIVRPVLILVTLPITIVTLGLFLFVINALMLLLAAAVVPGFSIAGFGTALLAALLLAVFNLVASSLLNPRRGSR
jgi:putative membrane protein